LPAIPTKKVLNAALISALIAAAKESGGREKGCRQTNFTRRRRRQRQGCL